MVCRSGANTGINFNRIFRILRKNDIPRNAEKWPYWVISRWLPIWEYNPASEYRFVSNIPDNNIIPGCFPLRGRNLGLYLEPRAQIFSKIISSLFADKLVALCRLSQNHSQTERAKRALLNSYFKLS